MSQGIVFFLFCYFYLNLQDDSIRSQIQAGADDFQVTSKTLPRFIWSEDEFDSEDLEQGMFKGILAVKVDYSYLHINRF